MALIVNSAVPRLWASHTRWMYADFLPIPSIKAMQKFETGTLALQQAMDLRFISRQNGVYTQREEWICMKHFI